jgi:hypothetical protein
MAGMRLPKNDLPAHMHEDVKIVNVTKDVTFIHSWGKYDENSGGDIVLGPRKYVYRKKFEAMFWFGNWEKTGKEWEAEVNRIGKCWALANPDSPTWAAIKNNQIYVEGYTDKKDYKNYSLATYVDKHQQFSLDGPEDSSAYMRKDKAGLVLDLPENFGEESADVTSLQK